MLKEILYESVGLDKRQKEALADLIDKEKMETADKYRGGKMSDDDKASMDFCDEIEDKLGL